MEYFSKGSSDVSPTLKFHSGVFFPIVYEKEWSFVKTSLKGPALNGVSKENARPVVYSHGSLSDSI